MKRLLLTILSVMAFAGMSVAQDIYSVGNYTNGNGVQSCVLNVNETQLFNTITNTNYGDQFFGDCADVDVYNGPYWVNNINKVIGGFHWAVVCQNENTVYLSTPEGGHIYDLYRAPNNHKLYSAGCTDVNAVRTAAVWENNNSYLQLGDGNWPSVAYGVTSLDNDVYTCGVQYGYEETSYHGVIWKGSDVFDDFPDGTKLYGIVYYDSYLWSVGSAMGSGSAKLKVWRTSVVDGFTYETYELSSNSLENYPERTKIFVDDAGDIYVVGIASTEDKLYKNGTEIYSTPAYFTSVFVNSNGVYYAGSADDNGGYQGTQKGRIWKDGSLLYSIPNSTRLTSLYVVNQGCTNNGARTLPYFEGFETGETDWACWEVDDNDNHNEYRASYWHRRGKNLLASPVIPASGNYCAWHEYGPQNEPQEGWLTSPRIAIPEVGAIKLTFETYEEYPGDYVYEGVWVVSDNGLAEVWSQPEEQASEDWKTVEVDLSSYHGQEIQIAFKYLGNYAHSWYIDNVSIEQDAAPMEYTIATAVNPVGAGTVDGAGTYPEGETVYLTASANPGWQFSHWNDGITTNPRSIIVNGNATYTANFLQQNYTLTVNANPAEGGTVTGGGSYHYGDVATLTATANNGFTFISWSDGNTNATRTVTVTGNATYTALFNAAGTTMYTVTVLSDNPLLGSVSGGGTYPEGAVIQITATPNLNARFVSWDDGNTDNPRDVIVTGNMTFHALFAALQRYTITVESANPTMGTATGGGSFLEGTTITISATPYSGYYFTSWDDGNADNPRTITVTQNATYKAQFSANAVVTYTLTVICNNAEGSVIGGGTYTAGATATIAAIPNSGYEFDKWSDGSSHNPRQVIVNDNMVFVAFFKGTGVDEDELNPMTLYPNPAKESIRILGIEANSTIEIYNNLGERVRTVNADPDQEIGVSDLASGLYLVRCGNRILRFIKQQ